MKVSSRTSFARRAAWIAASLFALAAASPALGQTCTFNNNQPGSVSFGTIDPTLSTPVTFSVILNFKCTGSANASFTITGQNDTGPGAYRLQNLSQPQFLPYSISTVVIPGTKITLNGQIVASDYQNAYVGNYADQLTVTILP
jgi:hypothetical protein